MYIIIYICACLIARTQSYLRVHGINGLDSSCPRADDACRMCRFFSTVDDINDGYSSNVQKIPGYSWFFFVN